MAFSLVPDVYARFADEPEIENTKDLLTYRISVDDENIKEVMIPAEGNGIIYNRYEVTDGEPAAASVLITLTVDENENIVG